MTIKLIYDKITYDMRLRDQLMGHCLQRSYLWMVAFAYWVMNWGTWK